LGFVVVGDVLGEWGPNLELDRREKMAKNLKMPANFLSPLGLACLCCVLLTGVGALESPADSQAVASLGEAPDCEFQPSSVSISPSSPSDLFPFSFSLLCFSPINSSSISFGKSSYVQTKDRNLKEFFNIFFHFSQVKIHELYFSQAFAESCDD
jgi:hypothetical protein